MSTQQGSIDQYEYWDLGENDKYAFNTEDIIIENSEDLDKQDNLINNNKTNVDNNRRN